ncbi:MAG: efflux RND transporter permease subunit [Sulfurimonas sp.]
MTEDEISKIKTTNSAGKLAKDFLLNTLTVVLAVFIIALGVVALQMMPREEDPKIDISAGSIIIPAPGLTPKEINKIITEPLEKKLREISGVEHIYSMSMPNAAVVSIVYYIGEDRETSNLKLYDKIMQNMDAMPKDIMQPIIKPFDIDISIPIVNIAFYQTNKNKSYKEYLSTIYAMQLSINALDNVSQTDLKGERKEQYNVNVDIHKLDGYHLSLGQVVQSIKAIAVRTPNITAKTKSNDLVIMSIKDVLESVEDVQNIIVAQYMGSPIYLKNIADVSAGIDIQNKQSASIILKDGTQRDQVTLTVAKLAGTNAVEVSDEIKEYLKDKKVELEKLGISYKITRDYGTRADVAVDELVHHIVITIAIIFVMLVVFLGWRESLIVTFTIPAILAITLFVAYMSGQTINRITLFAFLLSLGLLVDAGIIVIENIHRHLHDDSIEHESMDILLIKATDETGGPTNIATLAIVLTIVPMVFVGGMMGSFMKPIPLNVPVALIASLVVAYIFVPYLSKKLLKMEKK